MVFATVTSAKVLDNKAGNVQKRRVGRVDAYEHLGKLFQLPISSF